MDFEARLDILSEEVNKLRCFRATQETINRMVMNLFRALGPLLLFMGIVEVILARGFFK